MNMKKGKGTGRGNRACACVSIAFVALLFFSVAALSIAPVFANVQIDDANGMWSDSFDGANPEEGIAASTNITVADGDVKLSKTASDWVQTTQADFEAGVLNNVNTSTSSGDVKLELVPNPTLITSNNTDVFVKGTTLGLVKTLTFTKSGASYNELRIDSNLKIDSDQANKKAYSDIHVDGASKFTHETQSTTYVSYPDTLDFGSPPYADGEQHTIKLYLKTSHPQRTAHNFVFELYRTKTYASSGTIASQVYDTGAAGANWTALNWGGTLEVDTDITLEVRASDTLFAKDDATPEWTSVGGTSPVTSGLPSGRYVQWRAALSTPDDTKTPTLHNVTVSYSYFNTPATLTSIAITPTTLGGWSKFYADTTSPAGTSITFSILNATTNTTLISGISAADAENGYDISSISTANASIRLYALLSTSNASNTAELHDWNVSWIEPPTNLAITRNGSSMDLAWNGTADGEYDIYVTDDFTAGFPPALHATVTGLSWVDTDAANHAERYYRVGANGSGAEVGAGTVGKFDVATGNEWNVISLPFIPGDMGINEVIGDQLTGGKNPSEADIVYGWTGTTWGEMAWLFNYPGHSLDGKWITNDEPTTMTIDPDKGYWVQIPDGHPKVDVTVCGKVSDTDRNIPISVGWNAVGSTFPVSVHLDDSGLLESGCTGGKNPSEADIVYGWTGTTWGEMAWLFNYPGHSLDGKWITNDEPTTMTLDPGKWYWIQVIEVHSGFTWNYPKPY